MAQELALLPLVPVACRTAAPMTRLDFVRMMRCSGAAARRSFVGATWVARTTLTHNAHEAIASTTSPTLLAKRVRYGCMCTIRIGSESVVRPRRVVAVVLVFKTKSLCLPLLGLVTVKLLLLCCSRARVGMDVCESSILFGDTRGRVGWLRPRGGTRNKQRGSQIHLE